MKKFWIALAVTLLLTLGIIFIDYSNTTITVSEAKSALTNHPSVLSSKKIEAKVISVKQVPLYGYSTDIGHGLFIVNFSEPSYKKGDTIYVHITGAFKAPGNSSYLLNAWTE